MRATVAAVDSAAVSYAMSFVRHLFYAAAAATAAAAMAHGPRWLLMSESDGRAVLQALIALLFASAAFGLAVRRFTDGNSVVLAAAAALYAAHPAFAGCGRGLDRAYPGTAAPAIVFFAVAVAFAAAAIRRGPFISAPPLRQDRRRLAELALYALAAACDPRLAAAPLLVAVTDVWFHPDAPAAWRRSTLRTAAAATLASAAVGLASLGITGRLWIGDAGFFGLEAAAGGAFGFDPSSPLAAVKALPWIAALCAILPTGVLTQPAARPRAVLLAIGVAGLWSFVGALPSAVMAREAATLGVAGLALALPLLIWRAATALTAVGEFADLTPIPSVPALRDALASVDAERGPLESPTKGFDPAALQDAVRAAVDSAFLASRSVSNGRDDRWLKLLGPDRRQPSDDDVTARRRFVRDDLAPKLRGARSVLVVGDPPVEIVSALAERTAVDLRPTASLEPEVARAFELSPRIRVLPPSVVAEDAVSARYDAVVSFRGHDLGDAAAVVRHLGRLRREARRGAAICIVALSASGGPGEPVWDDLPEETP